MHALTTFLRFSSAKKSFIQKFLYLFTLDGNGATLIGDGRNQTGIAVNGRKNVTIRNVTLREYKHGILVRDSRGVGLTNNRISATGEVPANTVFLDIWLPGEKAYGGAIIEINPNRTPISALADVRLDSGCGEALTAIDAAWGRLEW